MPDEKAVRDVADLFKDFLFGLSEPLTPEAELLVERAKSSIRRRFVHGFHQLVALGIDERGNEHNGTQHDVPIGQASICAEVFAMHDANSVGATLTTLVTVHHKRTDEAGEKIHVVPPCGLCRERLLHFFPDCRVVVWLKEELRLVPIRLLMPLPYKIKKKNGNGGHAESQFDH